MVIEMVGDLAMMMDEMMDCEMEMMMVATSESQLDKTRATRKDSMMDSHLVDSTVDSMVDSTVVMSAAGLD